jgi:hypothetical protein
MENFTKEAYLESSKGVSHPKMEEISCETYTKETGDITQAAKPSKAKLTEQDFIG